MIDFQEYQSLRDQFVTLKVNSGLSSCDPVKWSPSESDKRYNPQRNIPNQNEFKKQVLALIGKANIKILCSFINSSSQLFVRLRKENKISKSELERFTLDYEKKSLEYLAQRMQMDLQEVEPKEKRKGLIIMEILDSKKTSSLVSYYNTLWHHGSGEPHFSIRLNLLFDSITCSHDFGCEGLQLADFIISSMCHAAKTKQYHFVDLYKKKIRKWRGQIKGAGIVVYPSNSSSVDHLIAHIQN